ncbi:hypothetical protein GLOTRDRAFT_70926 [Gloeophyllum trabeum ATCC 11539]|uniref:Uncharacterized protein n=1 Tax=Gloeophyllum trabeum (strain ATCC 11539 / FP-39264 / Madison 617) TaxID=670483 RepID=S7RX57_GLOTA|nr:uncharacterized protein GLOTRDRAFT_70926 [Gloeophyllum trabeum ATCC 11539]EPQ59465.1 hypothetical protein GLOTRDRAFT_70926 [Gloeophyllum trabeum ATCC 11539]
MPSIRVRRGTYSSLRDDDIPEGIAVPSRTRPRRSTVALFFPSSAPTGENPIEPSQAVSTSGRSRTTSEPGTIAAEPQHPLKSKVSNHILNGTWKSRYSAGRGQNDVPDAAGTPRQRVVSLEGSQVDVLVRTGQLPGRVGSALSVRSSLNDGASSLGGEHHEDDIVEHLDAIDPQIGTVSSLTNAANAILIPPLSLYSRKPIVSLPQSPALGAEDVEKSRGASHMDDLDHHVESVLSKRQVFKRTMKGVWAFVKTPLGFITAVYGFLVAFWGAAIVIFLLKIINFHNANTQGFWVEVSSQVENGLFTATGIGLIPFRAMDTYRIARIWYYKRKTRRLRKQAGLPELIDEDDLPDPIYDVNYVHVLTDEEQADLHYQQIKFMKSQTWYRPHGTDTHRAFPINTALLICCLIDGNSLFQIILCGTMWGLNRFERPAWSTGILIPASFLCGIFSGVFIWRGGQKTRRTEEVQERLRVALSTHPEGTRDLEGMTVAESAAEPKDTTDTVAGRLSLDRRGSATGTSMDDTPLVNHEKTSDRAMEDS